MPAVVGFAFGPYQLDLRSKRLLRDGVPVALTPRQFDVLRTMVQQAGTVLSKQALLDMAWGSIAVADNSLERMVSDLRALLDPHDRRAYIDTVSRQGYQFVAPITPVAAPVDEVDVAALFAPYRAFVEGRAALETLELDQITRARTTFEGLVAREPGYASFHIGLATACALRFESTRADAVPDIDALKIAARHAHIACQLARDSAEASATLGFVLQRIGDLSGALAALKRATMLEPDNWRHVFRLAVASCGEERLRAARETLRLCPDFPLAHLLAGSVWVARHDLAQARRDIDAGVRAVEAESASSVRFSPVALYYLKGLLCLAAGALEEAHAAFDAELALEARGHLYARECCANTWYAKGACALRLDDLAAARHAFLEAIARMPHHPMAHAGLALLARRRGETPTADLPDTGPLAFERVMARAAVSVDAGDVAIAVQLVADALRAAPPGITGWLVPIDPLLRVANHPEVWAPVLTMLHGRAR